MDSDHRPPDDANRRELDVGPVDDEPETTTGSGVDSGRDPSSDLGDDARSRLAGDRSDVEQAAAEEPTPGADAEAFLKRAFPEGDEGASSRREPPEDAPLHRSDVAEAMRSVDAIDTLLTLGGGCAAEGDWRGVQGVIDAIGVFDPTRQDQVRAVGVYHAVRLEREGVAHNLVDDMAPGRAQDGWRRYAEGDVVLPQHRVESREGLWGIAERYLGDGRRWCEIRDINGIGNDISAGWTLILPPDAERNE
jgi:nucleoid-associated protein YgaU